MSKIRKVTLGDRKSIIEISSKIWDGQDYISSVFEDWVTDKNRKFVCLTDNGDIHGFASMRIMPDESVWFEGLRVAPELRGRGYGKELTEYLVEKVKRNRGIIRLSTYFKNYESLHIVKKYGFEIVSRYNLLEKEVSYKEVETPKKDMDLTGVNLIPLDWVFYRNNRKNIEYIKDKVFNLGDEDGGIHISLSEKNGVDTTMNVFKVEYKDDAKLRGYFAAAEQFAFLNGQKYICTMLPYNEKVVKIALDYGFYIWEEAKENVVVLEKRF